MALRVHSPRVDLRFVAILLATLLPALPVRAQGFEDCNANGLPDELDIAVGTSPDCDANGRPDECDLQDPRGQIRDALRFSATSGGLALPLGEDANFGSAVAAIGDLDGNGVTDFAASTVGIGAGGSVRIVLRANAGGTLSEVQLPLPGGPIGPIDPGDSFGTSLAFLGDLDGNGTPELAISARGDDDHPDPLAVDVGAIWIVSLAPTGAAVSATKLSALNGLPTQSGDHIGRAIAAIGDIDGNGVTDLAIGVNGAPSGGTNRGAVWIVRLAAAASIIAVTVIGDSIPGYPDELDDTDLFGSSVAGLGDVGGDGLFEVSVGAPGDDTVPGMGAIWVLTLAPDGSAVAAARHTPAALGLPANWSGTGWSHSAAGIASMIFVRGPLGIIPVRVRPDLSASAVSGPISILDPVIAPDSSQDDGFGHPIASLGDGDGDGLPEWAVGTNGHDAGATDSGGVWVIFPEGRDCDGDGLLDSCEIASGSGTDIDGDGLLDSCEVPAVALAVCGGKGPFIELAWGDHPLLWAIEVWDPPAAPTTYPPTAGSTVFGPFCSGDDYRLHVRGVLAVGAGRRLGIPAVCEGTIESHTFRYLAPSGTIAVAVTAVPLGFTVSPRIAESPTAPCAGAEVQGFAMAMTHPPGTVSVESVEPSVELLAALGQTPDFFDPFIMPVGWSVGVVFDFVGAAPLVVAPEIPVVDVVYGIPGSPPPHGTNLVLDLTFDSTAIGVPPVTNVIVAGGENFFPEYVPGPLTVMFVGASFRRGDCDGGGGTDIGDAITALQQLFLGDAGIPCRGACDANDDGLFDIADPIQLLRTLFLGDPPPPPPYPECGEDPTIDLLSCDSPHC